MNDIYLVSFLGYLILFIFLFLFSWKKRPKNYSIFTHWISDLLESTYPSYPLFPISLFFLDLLGLGFAKALTKTSLILEGSQITTPALYLSFVSLMLISIPPADKKPKIHWRLAFLTVASVLVFFLLTIYPIYTSTKLPNFLAILNILIIISITFFSASILFLVKKFGEKSLSNFEKIKQKTKNWFLKNATVQEWVLFSLIFTWLFTATISLL